MPIPMVMDKLWDFILAIDPASAAVGASALGLLGIAVRAGLARFGQGYFRARGKHLAREHDLHRLEREVAALTKTAEQIKSDISGSMWTKQAAWTMKREAYGELVASCSEFAMAIAGQAEAEWKIGPLNPVHGNSEARLAMAEARFNTAFSVARIACDERAAEVLDHYWPRKATLESGPEVRELQQAATAEAQRELGLR